MNILFINALYPTAGDRRPIGGAETFSVRLVNGIRAAGHEVTVVRSGVSSHPSVEHTPEGVAVHSMPSRNVYPMADGGRHPAPSRLIWHAIDDLNRAAPTFGELIQTVQPDLVHTNNVVGLTSDVWRVARKAGIPILHTLHDYYATCPNAMRFSGGKLCTRTCGSCALLSRRRRKMSRNVDKVVGVSGRMLDIHRAEGVFRETPSEIILNTPPPSDGTHAMQPRPLGPVINFGYIGRQAVEKGIFDILAAFGRLQPGTARLLIAGAIDPAAQAWVAQHAPDAAIEFLGYIKPEQFFPQIDVAVFPSLWEEPCSMGVGEAFSYGIPVLGSKRGGTPELVENGRLGWLYEPDQPDALATLMAQLVSDRAEIAAKAEVVRQTQGKHGGDRLVAAYLAAYGSLVAQKAKRSVGRKLQAALAGLALLASFAGPAMAQPCRTPACAFDLPADSGALNVRDFGAKGDGTTDDTAAIRAALDASGGDTGIEWYHDRIVFLPAGTYLVSDSLIKRYANGLFGSGSLLMGAGTDRTVIRLRDDAPGFGDPAKPRGVIMTTSKRLDPSTNRDYVGKGEGNDAYENFVENLTVDVGERNPGAIGIDYLASNLGAVRDVLVRAPNGSGAIGIAMLRKFPGPALIQRVRVEGFDTGIALDQSEYGMTFSEVELAGQKTIGLRNAGNVASAERLTVTGPTTALRNERPGGLVVLADSDVGTVAPGDNAGTIVFRDTKAALDSGPATSRSGVLTGVGPFKPVTVVKAPPHPLFPSVDPGPSRQWAGVTPPPGKTPVDSTAAIQRALNSGARTVYLSHGTYWVSNTLDVPASVRRIVGMNSTILVFPERKPLFTPEKPIFDISAPGEPLEVDHLAMNATNPGGQHAFQHRSSRALLLRDIATNGVFLIDRLASGGLAVLEDTCCGPMRFAGPAPAVGRQLDNEGTGIQIENIGSPLSILGIKTEQECTAVSTTAGGRTEILGGLVFLVGLPTPKLPPVLISQNSYLSASFVEEVLQPGHGYKVILRNGKGLGSRDIDVSTLPARGLGHTVAMLAAEPQ